MDSSIIQVWVDEVNSCLASTSRHVFTPPLLGVLPFNDNRHHSKGMMSGSPKRRRTADFPDCPPDPERSPQQEPQIVGNAESLDAAEPQSSLSAYGAVLERHRPVFSLPLMAQQAPTEPSSSSVTPSHSSSPSKHHKKTASLLSLVQPVRFVKVDSLKKALPDEMETLMKALLAVSNREEILPAGLRTHPDFDDETIRPFMWQSAAASPENSAKGDAAILANHAQLQTIKTRSLSSSNLGRSEAAWNCRVHDPLLCHLTAASPHVEVEPITAARIAKSFRPLSREAVPNLSISASDSGDIFETPSVKRAPLATSVHKMVDFALVLRPDEELERLIDAFLSTQPRGLNTINQTMYEPLRRRPAPIFVETKTISGTLDGANVQLGIWVAAWHERIRNIMALTGTSAKVIALPVVQVMDDVWNISFAVDRDLEIQILQSNLRIGDTSSILGAYQLQAAVAALAKWMKDEFAPWVKHLLQGVVGA
ncbi:hypothetical protein ACJZ2D_010698 [Fusarium nematophilum]